MPKTSTKELGVQVEIQPRPASERQKAAWREFWRRVLLEGKKAGAPSTPGGRDG